LKVVERFLVGQIKNGESQGDFRAVRAKEIVRSRAEIKQVARCNAGWITVIVFRAIGGNAHTQGPAICVVTGRDRLCRSRKGAPAEESDLRLVGLPI